MSDTLTTPMSTTLYDAAHSANMERLHRLAADSEDPQVLVALAANPHLTRDGQVTLANNEYGDMRSDADDELSTGHAALLARDDLHLYPARVLLDVNSPQMLAALRANITSPVVHAAALMSHVIAYRALAETR